jgi:hypothetical protein
MLVALHVAGKIVGYPRESQEMVFDAHDRAFAFFRGTCTRGIYDNMKLRGGRDPRRQGAGLQPALPADARTTWVEPVACTPALGCELAGHDTPIGR